MNNQDRYTPEKIQRILGSETAIKYFNAKYHDQIKIVDGYLVLNHKRIKDLKRDGELYKSLIKIASYYKNYYLKKSNVLSEKKAKAEIAAKNVNDAIYMRHSGLTLQEIGDAFGLSRERIRQLINGKTLAEDKRLDAEEGRKQFLQSILNKLR